MLQQYVQVSTPALRAKCRFESHRLLVCWLNRELWFLRMTGRPEGDGKGRRVSAERHWEAARLSDFSILIWGMYTMDILVRTQNWVVILVLFPPNSSVWFISVGHKHMTSPQITDYYRPTFWYLSFGVSDILIQPKNVELETLQSIVLWKRSSLSVWPR